MLMYSPSGVPCSDGDVIEDQCRNEICDDQDHHDDNEDSCAITCICYCCGVTITYQPAQMLDLDLDINISTTLFSTYQSVYRFGFLSSIWEPPKTIS